MHLQAYGGHSRGPHSKVVRLFVKSPGNTMENGTMASSTRLFGLTLLQRSRQFSSRQLAGGKPKENRSVFRLYPRPAASLEVPEASNTSVTATSDCPGRNTTDRTRESTRRSLYSVQVQHITYTSFSLSKSLPLNSKQFSYLLRASQ